MHKFLVFLFLSTLSSTAVMAQDAPEAEKPKRADRVYRLALAGTGGFLGVELKEVSKDNFSQLGLREVRGVAISRVVKESAAETAGLQKGDVVVRFNGEMVSSASKFQRMIREVAPDHTAIVTVMRNGSELDIPVTMGKRSGLATFNSEFPVPMPPMPPSAINEFPALIPPMPPLAPRPPMMEDIPSPPRVFGVPSRDGLGTIEFGSMFSGRKIGVSTSSLTKQLGNFFGVEDGAGVLISNVSKDSPADKAGLRAGDVIVEIDGKAVRNTMDLVRGIGVEEDGPVNVTIVRDRNRQTISVTPEMNKDGNLLKTYRLQRKEAN